jgi:opacity protein-like surface antigen
MKNVGISLLSVIACTHMVFAGANSKKVLEPSILIPYEEKETVSGFYLGLGLSATSTHEADLDFFSITDGQDRTGDLSFTVGYDWNEYIAIEGRYMFSIAKEDIVDRSSWGMYIKPKYSVTEDLKVYGLLGLGGFDVSGTNHFGQNFDFNDMSFQWGLGVSYEVYENISIFVDYIQIARDIDATAFVTQNVDVSSDTITFGISYHF